MIEEGKISKCIFILKKERKNVWLLHSSVMTKHKLISTWSTVQQQTHPPYGKALLLHLSHSEYAVPRCPLPICFSMSAASSGVALGRMPGSVKLVLNKEITTNTKSTPPITGMKTVRWSTRNGQLKKKNLCKTPLNL